MKINLGLSTSFRKQTHYIIFQDSYLAVLKYTAHKPLPTERALVFCWIHQLFQERDKGKQHNYNLWKFWKTSLISSKLERMKLSSISQYLVVTLFSAILFTTLCDGWKAATRSKVRWPVRYPCYCRGKNAACQAVFVCYSHEFICNCEACSCFDENR